MAVLPPDPVFTIRNVDNNPVHSLAFHFLPGGFERLLAGSKNGLIYAYNLQTNRMQQKIQIGKAPILNIHHTDYTLIAQEKDGQIKIMSLTGSGYENDCVLNYDHCGFCRFEYDDKGEQIFVPIQDSHVQIYNINGEKQNILKPDLDMKLGMVMTMKHLHFADNTFLLAGYESGDLLLWDLKMNKCLSTLKLKECPTSIDYDLFTNRGIWGNASETLQIFSINKSDYELNHKTDIPLKNPGVNKVQLRWDRRLFATGGWDGRIRIISWKTLRPFVVLTEHKSAVNDVIYSLHPVSLWKSKIMAAGGNDGLISLWDLYNNEG